MRTQVVQDVSVPAFMYGTAWKEERTLELTQLALVQGFRSIDTANQRRHYFEAAVGDATERFLRASGLCREDLFLQTKFTHRSGQDQRLPYDPAAPVSEQLHSSFESSLEHLKTSYLDSYLLHGPSQRSGLAESDWAVWRAMEELQGARKTRLIGVSNVTLAQLQTLHREASVKPAFVQNRCYASTGWDRAIRAFCQENGIVYQGFSLLTANRDALRSPLVVRIARRAQCSPEQVIFCFARQAGMLPLTGTSSQHHMREDLAALELELSTAEVEAIARIGP
jgi:diketogulonate reductase-like aldo/keto reductase